MARTRRRAALRQEIRDRGDLQAPRHDQDYLDRMLDQGHAEFHRMIVSVCPDQFLELKTYDIPADLIGADGDELALPTSPDAEFYKENGVDVSEGGRWYPLRRHRHSERNQLQDTGVEKMVTKYRVMGNVLKLRPTPSWTSQVRLWYVPAAAPFSDDATSFDGINGYDEYLILWCVIRGKMRDRYDATEFERQLMELKFRIIEEYSDRGESEPDRVRDVDREFINNVFELGLPGAP